MTEAERLQIIVQENIALIERFQTIQLNLTDLMKEYDHAKNNLHRRGESDSVRG